LPIRWTIVESLVATESLHGEHVTQVILTAAVGIHVMVVIVITDQVTYRSLTDPGLSWWRVKVERLLLLRVRSRRPVAPANPSLSMVMPLSCMLISFEIDWSLDMRKCSSLIHWVVDVSLLE